MVAADARLAGGNDEAAGWPLIGHDSVVASLRASIERDRVSHAYLVAGPEGVGKSTLATAFAQALCCQTSDRADRTVPCGTCLACRKIARGTHPDVQLLDLETQRRLNDKRGGQNTTLTIDSVRQLAVDAALRPMEASRRILVVEDAEAMQEVAQEALLKTLEEPPPAVLLLLLTNDAARLLPTIQSRCQILTLRPVAPAVIARALVAEGVETDQARIVAALAAGRPGWAMRASRDPELLKGHQGALDRAMGWIEESTYARLVRAVRLGDGFSKRRPEVFGDLEALLMVWRDIMLIRAGLPELATQQAVQHRMAAFGGELSLESVTRAARSVQTCVADLEANVRPRLALEAMVLQWPTGSSTT